MRLSISQSGLDTIKFFEKFVPHFYIDDVGVGTIGYGSTMYDNGEKPKPGDVISEIRATELLKWAANTKANAISGMLKNELRQNQVDAILSLTYNIGVGGFVKSTVLKLINQNPDDPAIRGAFMLWNKGRVNGKLVELKGLTIRREKEADLYFKI